MKPRNKYEMRVAELNATLSEDIAVKDAEWAKKNLANYARPTFCYFTIFTNIKEFEVKRLYRFYKFEDDNTTRYFFVEIIREFNDGEKKLYFAKQRQMGSYYDCFTYSSDIELRGIYSNYAGYNITNLFELSIWSRPQGSGKRIPCAKINPNEVARIIKNNPVAENLYKNSDRLFGNLLFEPYAKQVCRSITLAKRHGFDFSDGMRNAIWFDMVRAIIYCKKDFHNPVFIAPSDLMATHDRFITMASNRRKREEQMRERRREELRLQREYAAIRKQLEDDATINEKYIKRRKRFYDMVITDGLIECRVLRDIKEFEEEGTAMLHCVFKCKYYEKPYSLILSARINGQRVETIEVNLANYSVNQCYGKHDQFTMHHQRIVDLINSNMDVIKAYNRNKKHQLKIAV